MAAFKYTNIAATTAAVANRLVTTANMKVGTYTVANSGAVWQGGFLCTVTHTVVTVTGDTLGTITFAGKDLHGQAISDTITPLSGTIATGTKVFKSVATITGAGWVIDAVEGVEDTIVCGVAAGSYAAVGGGILHAVTVNNVVATAFTISDAGGTIATVGASAAIGQVVYDVPWSGWLKIATTSTNDVTLIHSPGIPNSYAMS
jgi:hypothetical protein